MATINDVAEKAGVSVTTVSRVLNNRGYISEKTRRKVYETMEELHYQPNEIARSLLRKQSNLIGLIVPNVSHPFFGEFTDVVEHYAYEYGYKLLLCHSQLDPNKEREYIGMMKRHRVDGIIMGSHTLEVDEYRELNYPIVTVDRRIHQFPYVASDNLQGGRLAAQMLIGKGCRRIAHICGNRSLDMLANLRTTGFKEEIGLAGMESIILETNMDVFNQDEYRRIVSDLFTEYPDVDGVFTTSDIMASYVIKHCTGSGRRIPEDVRIVGYDDVAAAAWISPGITTIKQPLPAMGKRAVELIHKQINGETIEQANIFPVELIIRETT
ncbi:LacI family DNA-binding transcriptional regulator [Paenibacillus sp. MMS20-IR301]|uniref:LacI family DNA-binding transcriptional regulator n=1 Tax=Paenibacillus sp. MMS20-IR301 TaxID=2895946 RepID=UPI0028EF7D73|nr:LacI family DNA-binding transcriptional regulator [Paenibacillus sp. MMS20-IR301]WNS44222.1 LacI family DNA-binding transcriptional regulator [Paenibacillus sp. MMS20-IR301]